MDQQELLELIGESKIVLLLVFRGISIVKGIKITVSYLEDLQQIKELKRGGVIWEKIVFNGGWTISKISVTEAYLMTVIIPYWMLEILLSWNFSRWTKFMTFWKHHRIRKVKNSESPCVIPDYLYYNSGLNSSLSMD